MPLTDTFDKAVVGQWVAGYLAGSSSTISATDANSNERLVTALNTSCAAFPKASLLSLIQSLGDQSAPQSTSQSANTGSIEPGSPIAAIKFVRSGETEGLFLAGLIFVNGRWVLMPKPWRGLD